jgi:hypothetical protein
VRVLHGREHLAPDALFELEVLERELAVEQQEKPDDPSTLLTDESRRPLLDGTDWNTMNKAKACDEVEAVLRKGLKVLGDVALKALVARVLP